MKSWVKFNFEPLIHILPYSSVLKRKAYSDLMKWKEKEGHKPLVVTGARQVGKTYLIDYFARKNYPHYIYVDFSSMVLMRKAFESNLDVDNVLSLMNLYSDKR